MSGSIRQRSKGSWEVKLEAGVDPVTGKRKTVFRTVRGTKRQAEAKLVELQSEAARGGLIDYSKETLASSSPDGSGIGRRITPRRKPDRVGGN